MKSNAGGRKVVLDARRESLLSHAGGLLLRHTIRKTGLYRELSRGLAPWRKKGATHDPGKVVLDLAITLALGGDCVTDLDAIRAQPELFGQVASDPTVSRLIGDLAADPATADAAVTAIRAAHAAARAASWGLVRPLAGRVGSRDGGQVIVDFDATLIAAYSAKEQAAGTFKRGFGFHPMCVFVDHGAEGTGEVLAINLRRGNASANQAADHIAALDDALAQLPAHERGQVLVRADCGGGTKKFLQHVSELGLEFTVGYTSHPGVRAALEVMTDTLGEDAWYDALDANGEPAAGAQVADLTDWIPAATGHGTSNPRNPWPPRMRVIARRARIKPGEQHQIDDYIEDGEDGGAWRVTCFATDTPTTGTEEGDRNRWAITELDLRHRQRSRAEDRIRCAKDTGLRNLPYQQFDKNRIWVEIVALASDLLAWTQTLAFAGTPHAAARKWEPKTFRFRVLAVAGRLIRTSRQLRLRLPRNWPWNRLLDDGYTVLTT